VARSMIETVFSRGGRLAIAASLGGLLALTLAVATPADAATANGCATRVVGGPGPDTLRGSVAGDALAGRGSADVLRGGAGDDCLRGHRGADVLRGGLGTDVFGGGAGDDVIRSDDGRRELVNCGAGRDRAIADRGDRLKGCEVEYQFLHVHLNGSADGLSQRCSNIYGDSRFIGDPPSEESNDPVLDPAKYVGFCAGPLYGDGTAPFNAGTGRINWTTYRAGQLDITIRRMDAGGRYYTLYGWTPSRSSDALFIIGGDAWEWGGHTPVTGTDMDKTGQPGGPLKLSVRDTGRVGYEIDASGYIRFSDSAGREGAGANPYTPEWRYYNIHMNAYGSHGSCHSDAGVPDEWGHGSFGKGTCAGTVEVGDFEGRTIQVVWTGWNNGAGPGVDVSLRVSDGDQDYGFSGWAPNRGSGHFMVTGGEIRSWAVPPQGGTNLGIEPPGALNDPAGCGIARLVNQGTLHIDVSYHSGFVPGYSFQIDGWICR
jgi:RTX calcium-binding nonapeptide repeat (4 copies)